VSELRVRPPEPSDLADLTALYNQYVVSSPVTFDIEPFSVDQRRAWFEQHEARGRHRLFVAEQGERIVGYATSSAFRMKAAYDPSVETSVYVAPGATGRGIGSKLYAALFQALAREDVHRAYAGVTVPNPASLALHRRFGFRSLGTFDEVGRKFGRYWSVEWLEKPVGPAGPG
jgi:phosphinothricin acetyltransferase